LISWPLCRSFFRVIAFHILLFQLLASLAWSDWNWCVKQAMVHLASTIPLSLLNGYRGCPLATFADEQLKISAAASVLRSGRLRHLARSHVHCTYNAVKPDLHILHASRRFVASITLLTHAGLSLLDQFAGFWTQRSFGASPPLGTAWFTLFLQSGVSYRTWASRSDATLISADEARLCWAYALLTM
jgi:hypothetical protein